MKTKILMVCLGNICRSPLAEALLASKLDTANSEIDSAGTGHWHIGEAPDKRSISIAQKYGIDISNQKGRQFSHKDFKDFDHIFVMDNANKKDVLALAKTEEDRKKVKLIMNELFENENVDVPDPYFGRENGFEEVYKMLDEACEILAEKLSNQP
jgi:protein-tyrosine phosphatase